MRTESSWRGGYSGGWLAKVRKAVSVGKVVKTLAGALKAQDGEFVQRGTGVTNKAVAVRKPHMTRTWPLYLKDQMKHKFGAIRIPL